MILLSIISPVFNAKQYIQACIENVISQEIEGIEHIIVDGGSKDGTVEVIKHYASQYSHIRYISEKDHGQSDAMNKGIRMARGKIISFLNVDDFYDPNTLTQIIQIFETLPEPSFLMGNCKVWDDTGSLLTINKTRYMNFVSVYFGIVLGNFEKRANVFPVNPSCYFYHKHIHNIVGFYDVTDHYTMDFDFIVRILIHSQIHIKYKDENWGNYRLITGTKTMNQNLLGNIKKNLKGTLNKHYTTIPFILRLRLNITLHIYKVLYKLKLLSR